ncbi:AT-hook motif nuclear-localized protein 10 isoform X2 [Cinnamomum micranthum f. kanehirae]|uniref:AT-hook motif nuclear-localized protein n=1 Tax=Cinnamomum micranthum f. kanehirae TaxID=337451 RepID=A0A443NQ17_9MAGN|nr:AT-hook motif nuclear-localized protein 10 isoform X2 [Cinnamomum micranthum f. kanehirae]
MDARERVGVAAGESASLTVDLSSYSASSHNNSMASSTSGAVPMQNMCPPFNSGVLYMSRPNDSLNSQYHGDMSSVMKLGFSMSEPMKKRGRPRKYGPDDSMALALSPLNSVSGSGNMNSPLSEPSMKRSRGRPRGSGNKKQLEALGSAGFAFTPHIITVKAGEDVASSIMAFSQQGSRAVCILSANGAICNATLRQPATFGGTVTYEGRFEIISLSGSFLLTETDGTRSRTGGLSVALAGSDGRVLGGGVGGMLMAATPIQVVVGSFIVGGKTPKPLPLKHKPSPVPPHMASFGAARTTSPPSRSTTSESHDEPSSPLNPSSGAFNNSARSIQPMSSYAPPGWTGSHSVDPQKQ